jgi:CheY-like chemotaxis protein
MSAAAPITAAAPVAPSAGPAPRILSIDDSITMRSLVQMALVGYRVEGAGTGRKGIEAARAAPPDLILLDFNLPDLTGAQVCRELAGDPRTRNVPVIVLSAQPRDELRPLFAEFPSVADVLTKPFNGPTVAALIAKTLADRAAAAAAAAAEQAAAESAGRPSGSDGAEAAVLAGSTALMPLPALLATLGAAGRTGVLTLRRDDDRLFLFLRDGRPVLATCSRPDESLRQALVGVDPTLEESLRRAEEEQARSGKPVYASLAEAGKIPETALAEVLHEQGGALLSEALSRPPTHFEWREPAALPPCADRYGIPFSLKDLELERLRAGADRRPAEDAVDSPGLVFARSEGFAEEAGALRLTDAERTVLGLVDGRRSAGRIAEASGLPLSEVARILGRTSQVGLVRRLSATGDGVPLPSAATVRAGSGRPAFLLEPDAEGVGAPLTRAMARRGIPVIDIGGGGGGDAGGGGDPTDLAGRFRRDRPSLAVLNADALGPEAERLARRVRSALETSDVVLAAVCEDESPERAESLRAAGYDAVWVKPFPLDGLESLLPA